MTPAFLDTTVLVHVAELGNPDQAKADAYVLGHQPAEVPYYALQELLTGRVRYLCDAHNSLMGAENIGEAMLGLLRRSPFEGRKRETKQQALAEALSHVLQSNPGSSRSTLSDEASDALALKVAKLWLRARNHRKLDYVQALGCFNNGDLTFGPANELRGPNDSFNCHRRERCAAAAYIHEDKPSIKAMIKALHPSALGPVLGKKRENSQRKKALEDLLRDGPQKFDKGKCRALGDAYFAAMCPAGSTVATSNMQDHLPLCNALGKKVEQP